MRREQYPMIVPTANGAPATPADYDATGFNTVGAPPALHVADHINKTIQFTSIVGALTIEGSMDKVHWKSIGSAVGAGDSIQNITESVAWIRLNRTSGTPVSDSAIYAGFNTRGT